MLVVTLAAGGMAYSLPNIYRSITLIFIEPQKVPESYVKPTVTARIEDRLKTITQQILSRTRLEKIIQEFNLYQGTGRESQIELVLAGIPMLGSYWGLAAMGPDTAMERLVERMRRDIAVDVKKSSAFTISYQGADPELTMRVTSELASLFIEENLKIREQKAEGTTEFLESELVQIRHVLEDKEQQLKEFKQEFMGELPQQLESNLRALDRFQLERAATLEALRAGEARKESISNLLANSQQKEGGSDEALVERLDHLRSKLTKLQAQYKDGYPDIAVVRGEISQVQELLVKRMEDSKNDGEGALANQVLGSFAHNLVTQLREVKLEISKLRARQVDLNHQIQVYEKRVENTPLREQQLMTIMRDYNSSKDNYQSFLKKRFQARISENLEKRNKGEIFRVLDPANYPIIPYKPNRIFIVLVGIMLATGSGIGLVFLREQFDQSFATEEELSEAIGVPVLGTIPHQSMVLQTRSQGLEK